jgi:hypothetical protein
MGLINFPLSGLLGIVTRITVDTYLFLLWWKWREVAIGCYNWFQFNGVKNFLLSGLLGIVTGSASSSKFSPVPLPCAQTHKVLGSV